jgi:hypothetical protein
MLGKAITLGNKTPRQAEWRLLGSDLPELGFRFSPAAAVSDRQSVAASTRYLSRRRRRDRPLSGSYSVTFKIGTRLIGCGKA